MTLDPLNLGLVSVCSPSVLVFTLLLLTGLLRHVSSTWHALGTQGREVQPLLSQGVTVKCQLISC